MAASDLQLMVEEKARELYQLCDVERKGFVTRYEMQRLSGHLPLNDDQLESVFDSLDNDGDGQLTLTEFTGGFGAFLGINNHADRQTVAEEEELQQELQDDFEHHCKGYVDNNADNQVFDQSLEQLTEAGLYDAEVMDEEGLQNMWRRLKQHHPDMMPVLETFLLKIGHHALRNRDSYVKLEATVRSKIASHEEEVARLEAEMEQQIRNERAKLLAGERLREQQLREELEQQLFIKEAALQELHRKQDEANWKLEVINGSQAVTLEENERLSREKEVLEQQLEDTLSKLAETQEYIDDLQNKVKQDRRKRAKAAIEVSEGIALERESLVRQLDMLRAQNQALKDAQEERMLRNGNTLNDSLGGGERFVFCNNHLGKEELNDSISEKELITTSETSSGINFLEKGQMQTSSAQHDRAPQQINQYVGESLADLLAEAEEDCEIDGYYQSSTTDVTSSESAPPVYYEIENDDEIEAPKVIKADIATETYEDLRFPSANSASQTEIIELEESVSTDVASSSRMECSTETEPRLESLSMEMDVQTDLSLLQMDSFDEKSSINETQLLEEAIEDTQSLLSDDISLQRVFKIVFVGDSGVGKTSIVQRFCKNNFQTSFAATIGIDFQVKSLLVNKQRIVLQLWDTAGQERFRSITRQYFRKADGIVIVYDVTNEQSFVECRKWLQGAREVADEDVIILLLANKSDLQASSNSESAAKMLEAEINGRLHKVSAKTGDQVNSAFFELAQLLTEREDKQLSDVLRISSDKNKKASNCCACGK